MLLYLCYVYIGLQILQIDWEAILVLILLSLASNLYVFLFKLYFVPHVTLHTQVLNISPLFSAKILMCFSSYRYFSYLPF